MSGWHSTRELLHVPRVATFLFGRMLAATGIWLERIGLAWIVWELTAQASWVGVLAFVRLAPTLVLTPWGGVLADRFGAAPVLRACFSGSALVALGVVALIVTNSLSLAGILAMGALTGCFQAVATGPMKSILSDISPRALLATIVPLGSVTFHLAGFIGPALAGVLTAAVGTGPVFVLATITSLAFVVILRSVPHMRLQDGRLGSHLHAFGAAASRACSDPLIGPLMVMHLGVALFLRPVIDLLPVVAGNLLNGDAGTLGVLSASMGLGALAGSLWMTWRSGGETGTRALRLRVLSAGFAASFAAIALAASISLWQAGVCLFALGAALVMRGAGGNTLVQLTVTDSERGRVMSLWGMVLRLGAALGGLALGIAADYLGLRSVLIGAGGLVACFLLVLGRALWRLP